MVDGMKNYPTVINLSVRDRAGDPLIETDFPRLTAQRIIRRTKIRRMDAEYADRHDRSAAIVESLERPVPRRAMAVYLPAPTMATRPARNATRWAMLVAAALAVAALVLVVA